MTRRRRERSAAPAVRRAAQLLPLAAAAAAAAAAAGSELRVFIGGKTQLVGVTGPAPGSQPTLRGGVALEAVKGRYRALTRIRVRDAPDTAARPTGTIVETGETFEATETQESGDLGYLWVKEHNGWIFDQGIAGKWVGKPIVELLEAAAEAAATAQVAPAAPTPAAAQAPPAPSAATIDVEAPSVAPSPVEAQPVEATVALATTQVETMRLPENMLGAGFELVRLEFPGQRRLTFMLGSGFPKNAITQRGQELLGDLAPKQVFTGGWMSQAAKAASNFDIKDVKFASTNTLIGDLNFEVLDFPQQQLAGQLGMEVHGILGQPFFAEYDMDLDRYGGRATFYAPGQASAQGFDTTVKFLPGLELPAGNLGIVVKSTATSDEGEDKEVAFLGLVDTSALHTVLNWEAAKLLGYSGMEDTRLAGASKVLGADDRGQAAEMPVVLHKFKLCGIPEGVKPMMMGVSKEQFETDGGDGWYLDALDKADGGVQFGAVNVAIGDVLSLSVLRDSKIGAFRGAAAVIGQDLLFQAQRVVLNMRDRQLWLEPGDVRDAPEM